jgi:hypothetical protein
MTLPCGNWVRVRKVSNLIHFAYNGIIAITLKGYITMSIPTLDEVIEQVERLSPEDKKRLLVYLQEEADFESNLVEQAIGDILSDDGSIDFDKLYQQGKHGRELHGEFPDIIDENGHIGDIDE